MWKLDMSRNGFAVNEKRQVYLVSVTRTINTENQDYLQKTILTHVSYK